MHKVFQQDRPSGYKGNDSSLKGKDWLAPTMMQVEIVFTRTCWLGTWRLSRNISWAKDIGPEPQ